jgi:proprotein convertase subtilisin/kexin type 5
MDCNEGCISGDTCNLCVDPLCNECESYDKCTVCAENTKPDTFPCECEDSYFETQLTSECSPCDSTCFQCTGEKLTDCTECHDGEFM